MAPKVTSSSNRSKRSASKPVTQGQNPQRANRQKTSQAKNTGSGVYGRGGQFEHKRGDTAWTKVTPQKSNRVTTSSQRTSTGSARVTTSDRPALPPGNRGGAITRSPGGAMTTTTRNGGGSRPLQAADGRNVPLNANGWPKGTERWADSGRSNAARPALPASATRAVAGAAKGAGALRGGLIGAIGMAGADYIGTAAGNAIGNFLRENTNKPKDGKPNRRGTRKPATATPERQGPPVPDRIRNASPAPQLPPPSTAASPRRSSGGGGSMPSAVTRKPSSSAPKAPAAPAKPGQKFEDFNPNRGTSKTNNPLMKDFVGRMKDREDKAQASAASKVTSKFNTESNFSAEKVDGSKVDTKAKMKSTTSEYDKKKRRYGG